MVIETFMYLEFRIFQWCNYLFNVYFFKAFVIYDNNEYKKTQPFENSMQKNEANQTANH